ncbi:UvrD-helicase domain-containing protein [Listeria booriae]|uniref:UvrD-helicase domain-containing protein n=1 Tax=Listeria booriae TaxID=1552123 RepID=A0A842B2Y8_9LIST|nr:UvrD-helicase domain-containing protein [Listeria booriae]MBC1796185.1 UvrD-helicase domain-containing protein [Listeria booriae]
MSISDEIIITDDDIDWVESIFDGDIRFDLPRREIIKSLKSVDIQAFPGSGKTTILVAKLAILAKKWNSSSSGICVLSHTNVAREEIEKRLGNTEVGASLLRYPHFIGTVHSFFNSFMALPWIRSKGYPIEIIDTEFVSAYRWNMLPKKYRVAILHKKKSYMDCCYKNELGKVEIGNLGEKTATYKAVKTCIEESQKKGYFTFRETLLFAQEAISSNSRKADFVKQRFPILFIDEAQDTNSMQWDLINNVFTESIYQGFGDENQAIYNFIGETDNNNFPRDNPLILAESKRFNSDISKLTNPLAISKAEMIGVNRTFRCENTIFLYNVDKIDTVLAEYSKLVLSTFTDEELKKYKSDGCYAIGMVHAKKEATQREQLPKGIFDYWGEYNPRFSSKKMTPKYLIEYFVLGRNELNQTGEANLQVEWVLKGLRKLINDTSSNIIIEDRALLINSFINKLDSKNQNVFRINLLSILNRPSFSEIEWIDIRTTINLILNLFGIECIKSDFLDWRVNSVVNMGVNHSESSAHNTFRYTNENDRSLDVKLGSIHSVKGQTHLSTLVLETFSHKHNLVSIIPFISGAPLRKKVGVRDIGRLKCHYVAMTRARGLLCLAIPKDKVDEESIERLGLLGWNVQTI